MREFPLVARYEVHAEDVESPRWRLGLWELAHIAAREATQRGALVRVDGSFSGSEIARGARFDFDEAKHRAIPGNQIDVSRNVAGGPSARDDGVAFAAEIEEGGIFAFETCDKMRRQIGRAASALCNAIEDAEGTFEKRESNLRSLSHDSLLSTRGGNSRKKRSAAA